MFLALKHLSFIFLSAVILPITAFCCLCSCKERRKLYTIKDIKQMHIKLSHWLLLLTSGFITSTKTRSSTRNKRSTPAFARVYCLSLFQPLTFQVHNQWPSGQLPVGKNIQFHAFFSTFRNKLGMLNAKYSYSDELSCYNVYIINSY